MKRLLSIVAGSLILLITAKYFLLDRSSVPQSSNFSIDFDAVRKLAVVPGKPLPLSINSLLIGEGAFPSTAVVAGTGFSDHKMVFTSFQIVYPDRTSVIIDSAMNKAMQDEMFSGNPFHQDHFDQMQKAMLKSSQILITHEHPDHLGGIATAPDYAAIRDRVILSEEQINGPAVIKSGMTPEMAGKLHPFKYDRIAGIAPGIVLIKAPGHSPGTQIIYVQLAGGREFLFLGDVVWSTENIEKLTGRPLLISLLFLHEDREAVANQIRYLHDLQKQQNDKIHFIIAHDAGQYQDYIKRSLIREGFDL